LITERWASAFAVDAEGARTTAEDSAVLDVVNAVLLQITNVG
jgi:hypothetical protein